MRKSLFALAAELVALQVIGLWAGEVHTNSFERGGVTYAQRGGMGAETYVVTNVDTEAIVSTKRDKTDLKVYRKVKDIWRWSNWDGAKVQEPFAKDAPYDFLAVANSPGSEPIHFERGAWWGAVQFWPNGKVRYSQSEIPPGGTGQLSTTVNFAMYAYDETGTNEIYRFGATATREDPTNDTVVAWDETRNQYVRVATTDMVDEAVKRGMTAKDGTARPLPPYIHYMPFDDVYTNDAAWYYEQAATNYVHGSCSARRVGGILERNYDWEFDRSPEFVIPVSGSDTRFASVGIANVGRLLTEDFVNSGKWSRNYRCLPGHTLDGVNENGVVAEINVVGGDPFEEGWTNDVANGIHPLGAVRWALDNGTSAEMVATSLAVRVKFPAGWSQNFHYMIADAAQTWIVENGAAHLVGGASVSAVMTNFRLYPTHDTNGEGQERYAILSNPANSITDAWFTRCYKRETTPPWTSDLTGLLAYTNAIYDTWATHNREFFRDMSIDGKSWWQTVHTSIYDFQNRTLRIAVQETDDWYTFAVPSAGGVKPDAVREIVQPMIEVATNDLSDTISENYIPREGGVNVGGDTGFRLYSAYGFSFNDSLVSSSHGFEVRGGRYHGDYFATGTWPFQYFDLPFSTRYGKTDETTAATLADATAKANAAIAASTIISNKADKSEIPDVSGFVPSSRKINGQPLTNDITIAGMPTTGLVWNATAGKVKTVGGRDIGAADVGALRSVDGFNGPYSYHFQFIMTNNLSFAGIEIVSEDAPPTLVRIADSGFEKYYTVYGGMYPSSGITVYNFVKEDYATGEYIYYGHTNMRMNPYMDYGFTIERYNKFGERSMAMLPQTQFEGAFAIQDWSSLRTMLADANTSTNADCECISTNICKLIAPHIEPVNVIAELYDGTKKVLWSVTIDNGDMKYGAKTNVDTTAYMQANSVMKDKALNTNWKVRIEDSEMKFDAIVRQ